jgi:hypothetical protein
VEGIVRRNDGQATVWVNRKPTAAPEQAGAVRIGPVRDASDGADLRLPDGGHRVRIKVGQEVDVQSGRIQERYRQPAAAPQPVAPETKPATSACYSASQKLPPEPRAKLNSARSKIGDINNPVTYGGRCAAVWLRRTTLD